MGLLTSVARKKYLRHQKSYAEFQLQIITQKISVAQKSCNDLMLAGTEYEADSKIAKQLLQRQQKLQQLEKALEDQKSALELQINECTKEIESCDQMIQENVGKFFSYGAK